MSSEEDRRKRQQRLQRNHMAKELRKRQYHRVIRNKKKENEPDIDEPTIDDLRSV